MNPSAKNVVARFTSAGWEIPRRVKEFAEALRETLVNNGVVGTVRPFNSGYVGISIDMPEYGKWYYFDQPGVVGLEDHSVGYISFQKKGVTDPRRGTVYVKHRDRSFGDVQLTPAEYREGTQAVLMALESMFEEGKQASYTGNPDGKPIYPVEVDHGYDQALAGGTDIMKRVVDRFMVEQGRKPRDKNPRLATEGTRRRARVEFHVEYVNSRTLRLMVYGPQGSSFFEARVGPKAAQELADQAARQGFRVPVELIEEEIESK